VSILNIVPADIFAIKMMGVKSWQEIYYWPVSDIAFFGLLDEMWTAFDDFYQEADEVVQDLLLADSKFISLLAHYLHLQAVNTICVKEGKKMAVGQLSRPLVDPDWEALASVYDWKGGSVEMFKFQLRRIAKRLKFNKHLTVNKNISGFLNHSDVWSIGSFCHLKSDYTKKYKIYCDHPYVATILPKKIQKLERLSSDFLENKVGDFFEKIAVFCLKEFLLEFDSSLISKCWLQRLESLENIYRHVRNIQSPPKMLLFSEVGKPIHKIIALALKSKGTRIIGFHHGNDIGNMYRRMPSYNEYSACDIFVCPTKKTEEFKKNEHYSSRISRHRKTEFESIETSYYKDIHEQCGKGPFPGRVRKVMIVGYPMNIYRYQYSCGDFFLFQLDLELRLARMLKKSGHEVIYKAHPTTKDEVKGIFDGIVDNIIFDPFETVFKSTDSFVFGNSMSTTFGFAIGTTKPIYLIDIKGTKWNQEAYDLLKKRCVMVPAQFDHQNRIQFDEELLASKLSAPAEPPNFEYLERFMFPLN